VWVRPSWPVRERAPEASRGWGSCWVGAICDLAAAPSNVAVHPLVGSAFGVLGAACWGPPHLRSPSRLPSKGHVSGCVCRRDREREWTRAHQRGAGLNVIACAKSLRFVIYRGMRGRDQKQALMFTAVSPESVVPLDHPLRRVKALTDDALRGLTSTFESMYARTGRPSIPPERLLKASLLMALYSIRSERMFAEQLQYNLLFKWFLDMSLEDVVFDASTFSKNRERLMNHDAAGQFFRCVVGQARAEGLMSSEHFTVDGTLIEADASLKSFKRKDDDHDGEGGGSSCTPGRNAEVNFHGEKRSNESHRSTTDPESRLARKGSMREAKLYFSGHALMENRNGLLVDVRIAQADGFAEREIALQLVEENVARGRRATVAGDKGYDTRGFVRGLRDMNVTPHVARHTNKRSSAVDGRTTRHPGYGISQVVRKRVEEIFGWFKTVGGLRRSRFRGVARTQLAAYVVGAAYNLLRIARLAPT
jgi:transposase